MERSAVSVLGMITAGLALAALAAQPRPAQPADPPRVRPTATQAPSPRVLRALRDGARIDVNRATAADLELLPGVGPTLARRIVSHRSAHGAFASADGLLNVHGIGRRTLDRLAPLLAFGPDADGGAQPSNMNTRPALTAK